MQKQSWTDFLKLLRLLSLLIWQKALVELCIKMCIGNIARMLE